MNKPNKFEQLWRDYLKLQNDFKDTEDTEELVRLHMELLNTSRKVHRMLELKDAQRFRRVN